MRCGSRARRSRRDERWPMRTERGVAAASDVLASLSTCHRCRQRLGADGWRHWTPGTPLLHITGKSTCRSSTRPQLHPRSEGSVGACCGGVSMRAALIAVWRRDTLLRHAARSRSPVALTPPTGCRSASRFDRRARRGDGDAAVSYDNCLPTAAQAEVTLDIRSPESLARELAARQTFRRLSCGSAAARAAPAIPVRALARISAGRRSSAAPAGRGMSPEDDAAYPRARLVYHRAPVEAL